MKAKRGSILECRECRGTRRGLYGLRCSYCKGTGREPNLESCPTCRGGAFDDAGWECRTCAGFGNVPKPRIKRVILRLFRTRKKPIGPVLTDWMVVRVKNNHERMARHWMHKTARDHIETFVPYVEVPGGRGKQVALFPGFVFVRPHSAWFYIKSTPGVLEPIMMGNEPARMPIRDMQLLTRATDKEGVLRIESDTYLKGEEIRAHGGIFKNLWGVYIGDGSKRGRVRVLYQILSRPIEVEYGREEVTSAPMITSNDGPPIASHDWRAIGGARHAATKRAPT